MVVEAAGSIPPGENLNRHARHRRARRGHLPIQPCRWRLLSRGSQPVMATKDRKAEEPEPFVHVLKVTAALPTAFHSVIVFGNVSPDDIRRAVLEREDVAKYLRDDPHAPAADARARIESYLEELRTTQRYRFYRALRHPLYPILRKVEHIAEHIEHAREGVRRGRVVYVSNHKSHLDYLIEPLVLIDSGIRPPLLAAGINLFGGALGLLHKHVTGAVPIRRNSKDPLYLVTLRAYIAELLKERDLLYYAEGGRSYTGELKTPKTGLLQAALQADRDQVSIVPMAIAYDLVLEERIITREASRKRKRLFAQEVAEMVRHAVGYETRAFVTFAPPVPLGSVRSRLAPRSRGADASGA